MAAVILASMMPAVAAAAAPAATGASGSLILGWGQNSHFELGDGTTSTRSTPAPASMNDVAANTTFTQIVGGAQYGLALTSHGQVYGWGYNGDGEVGDGTFTNRDRPVSVHLPADANVTAISAGIGGDSSLALTDDGRVLTWGNLFTGDQNTPIYKSGLPGAIKEIAAGGTHKLALAPDGAVWAWGNNYAGQLGNGNTTDSDTPVQVIGLPVGDPVQHISGGIYHSLAVTQSGKVYAWGGNLNGQLGNGTTSAAGQPGSTTAAPVLGLPADDPVTQVAGGGWHSLALTASKKVYAWGDNEFGALGDGTKVERHTAVLAKSPQPALGSGVTIDYIVAGEFYSLALTSAGQVLSWGRNHDWSELGDGTSNDRSVPGPVSETGPGAMLVVAIGTSNASGHAIGASAPSSALAWGDNESGQVGNNNEPNDSNVPVPVQCLPGDPVVIDTGGYNHTVALTRNGAVYAWGQGTYGQLGQGETIPPPGQEHDCAVPVTGFPSGTNVVDVDGGQFHSVAVLDNGAVYSWGTNKSGVLGIGEGDSTVKTKPTLLSPPLDGRTHDADGFLIKVVTVATYNQHNLALTDRGKVYAWGYGGDGELGLGDNPPVTRRVGWKVTALDPYNVTHIGTGYTHSVARSDDGTAWAWGANGLGQLGNSSSDTFAGAPVRVQKNTLPSGVSIAAVEAGGNHSLAVGSDGNAYAWGSNSFGQLGAGSQVAVGNGKFSGSPVAVSAPTGGLGGATYSTRLGGLGVGGFHSVAVLSNGKALAWGWNNHGQVGAGDEVLPIGMGQFSAVPLFVALQEGTIVNGVGAGQLHSLAH
jgi:alpha-tubulin suppressor-like RCC1 family protein